MGLKLALVTLVIIACFGVNAQDDSIRLPDSVIPEHYRIRILSILDQDDFRMVGNVHMNVFVRQATDRIVLHAVDLTLLNDSISVAPLVPKNGRNFLDDLEDSEHGDPNLKERIAIKTVSYDSEKEFVVIRLASKMEDNRRYGVHFNYRGKLSKGLKGFYRSDYLNKKDQSKRYNFTIITLQKKKNNLWEYAFHI